MSRMSAKLLGAVTMDDSGPFKEGWGRREKRRRKEAGGRGEEEGTGGGRGGEEGEGRGGRKRRDGGRGRRRS